MSYSEGNSEREFAGNHLQPLEKRELVLDHSARSGSCDSSAMDGIFRFGT